MNYLQFNDRGKFELEEQALAEYFGEGEYKGFYKKHFLRDRFQITKDDFISGDIDVMFHAMKRFGIEYSYNDYPECLKPYLHRKVWEDKLGNVKIKLFAEGCYLKSPIFIKPKDRLKRFTGFVLECVDDLSNCRGAGNQTKIWCSEPVVFVSEFRCYLRKKWPGFKISEGRVLTFGSFKKDYNQDNYLKVAEFITRLPFEVTSKLPSACALDFGILSTGEVALIEMNDAFSLGLYTACNGTDESYKANYCECLIQRWEELKNGKID